MPHDRVNRDNDLEIAFAKYHKEHGREKPHIEYLYRIFLQIKGYDIQEMRIRLFKLTEAAIYFAIQHKELSDLVAPEEEAFYDYTEWFFINRLLNTGTGGFARCERSPIFVQPTSTRAVR